MKTIASHQLTTVTGGGGTAPLSGDVHQNINTNWGGTQIINEAPKPTNSVVDYMRTNPAARLDAIRRQSTPVRRF